MNIRAYLWILIGLAMTCSACGALDGNQGTQDDRGSRDAAENERERIATAMADHDVYLELRNGLLDINPAEFGWSVGDETLRTFGIVIDWYRGDSLVTVSAYKTGDASVYFGSGVLYMGGVEMLRIREKAIGLVETADTFVEGTDLYDNRDLPEKGTIKFYFVTNKGLRVHKETGISGNKIQSDWKRLFATSQAIVDTYEDILENSQTGTQ